MTDTMKTVPILLLLCLSTLSFCTTKPGEPQGPGLPGLDTPVAETVPEAAPPLIETVIEKELLYDQHTLADTYPYKDTMREFQWDKIRAGLRLLDSLRQKPSRWAIFQNYRNKNGEAPLVRKFHRDAYKRVSDTLGIERYQSVPLYLPEDTLTAERYGRDGALVKLLDDSNRLFRIQTIYTNGEWLVPGKYVKCRFQMVGQKHESGHNRAAPSSIRTGNAIRHICRSGKEGKDDLPRRRQQRDRRIRSLCQPVHQRRLYPRGPGKRATQVADRIQPNTWNDPTLPYVRPECDLSRQVRL